MGRPLLRPRSAASTTFTYDSTLEPSPLNQSRGKTSSYTRDSDGNLLTTTDPLSRSTANTYNSHNQLLTCIDGIGVTTTNTGAPRRVRGQGQDRLPPACLSPGRREL
jgi:YD repeat-containing protein